MAFELMLPDIGEGVVEAEIQKWFVKPGDAVEEDQPLVEVMTDKATVVIPSPRRGKVTKLHYAEGAVARVHAPLLVLELEGEAGSAPSGRTPAGVPAAQGERAATPAGAPSAPALRRGDASRRRPRRPARCPPETAPAGSRSPRARVRPARRRGRSPPPPCARWRASWGWTSRR